MKRVLEGGGGGEEVLSIHKTFMNFASTSCFFCSSDVGNPMAFCRWSYIIFSTVCRVSPDK